MPSLAEFLIHRTGWRHAYLILGGVVLVIGAPIVAAFLRNAPEDVDLSVDGIRENWEPTAAPVPPAGLALSRHYEQVCSGSCARSFFLCPLA